MPSPFQQETWFAFKLIPLWAKRTLCCYIVLQFYQGLSDISLIIKRRLMVSIKLSRQWKNNVNGSKFHSPKCISVIIVIILVRFSLIEAHARPSLYLAHTFAGMQIKTDRCSMQSQALAVTRTEELPFCFCYCFTLCWLWEISQITSTLRLDQQV